jgi:hypothetical protein
VRCTAGPDPRANAVGTLVLECTEQGLILLYLGVATHRSGYAPGPPASGMLRVPWSAVNASPAGDRLLLLEIDPALSPHNRLLLSRFQSADALHPLERRRRQQLIAVSAAAIGLMAALVLLSARVGSLTWLGAVAALAGALGTALLVLSLGLARRVGALPSMPTSDAAFLDLSEELSRYLPALLTSASPWVPEPRAPFWSPARLEQLLPRTAVGIAIALTASGLATVLTSVWLLRSPTPVWAGGAGGPEAVPGDAVPQTEVALLPVEPMLPLVPVPATPPTPTTPSGATSDRLLLGASCECARPASILWDTGVPRLATLVSGRRDDWQKGHPHISFELNAINNGDRPLERLSLRAVFYEDSRKNPSGRRIVADRPLYYQGPLAPGSAVSWRVEARGSSFEVLAPDLGALDEYGGQTAPPDAFDRLGRDRHRAVRMHASMMLAFLGDERARPHALELRSEGRELEVPYLNRVLQAVTPLRACEVVVNSQRTTTHEIECCIQNVGKRPAADITLRVRAVDGRSDARSPLTAPPLVFAESSYRLGGVLEPQTGRAVELSFETAPTSPSPLLFEYVVESGSELQ